MRSLYRFLLELCSTFLKDPSFLLTENDTMRRLEGTVEGLEWVLADGI
jgi:hypothetical protein